MQEWHWLSRAWLAQFNVVSCRSDRTTHEGSKSGKWTLSCVEVDPLALTVPQFEPPGRLSSPARSVSWPDVLTSARWLLKNDDGVFLMWLCPPRNVRVISFTWPWVHYSTGTVNGWTVERLNCWKVERLNCWTVSCKRETEMVSEFRCSINLGVPSRG